MLRQNMFEQVSSAEKYLGVYIKQLGITQAIFKTEARFTAIILLLRQLVTYDCE